MVKATATPRRAARAPTRARAGGNGPDLPPELLQRRAERLAEAVRARRVLQIRYGGAWRIVHPHALGRTGTGRLGLLTWQTAGVPRGRGPDDGGEGWRMFDIARIEEAELLRATFTPRPRAPRKGWTPGIAAPISEVPSRAEALAAPREADPAERRPPPDRLRPGGAPPALVDGEAEPAIERDASHPAEHGEGIHFRTRCPLATAICARDEPRERRIGDAAIRCHHA